MAVRWLRVSVLCVLIMPCLTGVTRAQDSGEAARARTLDQLLDLYVRNGDVYYRAVKSERGRLDAYINQLAAVAVDKLSRDEQLAFWLNAYNALVLRTIV